MAQRKNGKKHISEGVFAGIAGIFLLFVSMFNPTTAATIAVAFLLIFSAYKFLFSEK
jgi:hypothetical protein